MQSKHKKKAIFTSNYNDVTELKHALKVLLICCELISFTKLLILMLYCMVPRGNSYWHNSEVI